MKLLSIVLLFLCFISKAQVSGVKSKDISSIYSTKTMVVLSENDAYNELLKASIIANWKITPFEFIDSDEVFEILKKDGYSVLMPITKSIPGAATGMVMASPSYMTLIKSGLGHIGNYSMSKWFAYVPVQCLDGCVYKMDLILKSIQSIVKEMKEIEPVGNLKTRIFQQMDYYRKFSSELKTGVLLLEQKDVDVNAFRSFKSLYPYKIMSVSEKDIYNNSYETKAYLLSYELIPYGQIVIYDLQSGKPVYFQNAMLTNRKGKLNDKAVMDLLKSINK